MQFTTILIAAFASLAVAQSTLPCQAQNILDACVGSIKGTLTACTANDYGCMCTAATNLLTCYNNCPNDAGRFGVEQQKISWCGAASAYPTTSSSAYSNPTISATPLSSPGSTGAKTTGSSDSSATGSSASASSTGKANSAGHISAEMGSVVAVGLVGLAGLLL